MGTVKFHNNKIVLTSEEGETTSFNLMKFPTINVGATYIQWKGETYLNRK